MIKVFNVVGARPQIIKASAISRAIRNHFSHLLAEVLIHTGQHYDRGLSAVFFKELEVPQPQVNLHVGSSGHSRQIARIMTGMEELLKAGKPDWVIVYGDTNSTMAAALATAKCNIPVVHIEAGLRSFNRSMPEEINRIVTDHISTLLFSPTDAGFNNLIREGFNPGQSPPYSADHPKIYHSGDIMYDNSSFFGSLSEKKKGFFRDHTIDPDNYCLATIHRENNTDNPDRLENILEALLQIIEDQEIEIVLPLHPRTKKAIYNHVSPGLNQRIKACSGLKILPPVSFLEMTLLEKNSKLIMTDSGGVQKESHFFEKPCLVFRSETEWVELVQNKTCILADADKNQIINGYIQLLAKKDHFYPAFYGDGETAEYICQELIDNSRN